MQTISSNIYSSFTDELLSYRTINNKILYLTAHELVVISVQKQIKKQSIPIKGKQIQFWEIGKKGLVALLYTNGTLQVRKLQNLKEVIFKFSNIKYSRQPDYPKMRWDLDELYLLYQDSILILNANAKTQRGFTDIITDYPGTSLMDIQISHLLGSQSALILQIPSVLMFSITSIPICDIYVPNVNQMLLLAHPMFIAQSKRQFLAILLEGKFIRVLNCMNLKCIIEVDLKPNQGESIRMDSDPYCQYLLIRYTDLKTGKVTRNSIMKINADYYYSQTRFYFRQAEPFFLYSVPVNVPHVLSLFPSHAECLNGFTYNSIDLIYFKDHNIYFLSKLVLADYQMDLSEFGGVMGVQTWEDTKQWRELVVNCLDIVDGVLEDQKDRIEESQSMEKDQRLLKEYQLIKYDLERMVAEFSQIWKKKCIKLASKEEINQLEGEWNLYLAKYALDNRYLVESTHLFKLDIQLMKENMSKNQGQYYISEVEKREKRVNSKIDEKKKELQKQKVKQLQKHQKQKITYEEIQKEEQEYQRFVAEFFAEKQKKEKQQKQRASLAKNGNSLLQLVLPHLSEVQKKKIKEQIQKQQQSPLVLEDSGASQFQKIEQMLISLKQQMHGCLSPLESQFQALTQRLITLESTQMKTLSRCQKYIDIQSSVIIPQIVQECVNQMFSKLNKQIQHGIDQITRKIYHLQDRSYKYREDLIDKYKEFIKWQIKGRVDIFYARRKQIQKNMGLVIQKKA